LPLQGASFTGFAGEQDFFLILKVVDRYGAPVVAEPVQFNVVSGGGTIVAFDKLTDSLGVAAARVDLGPQIGEQIFSSDVGGFHVEFFGRARRRPVINSGGVVNAGSHVAGQGLAPGSYIEIYGAGLSETPRAVAFTPYLPVALSAVSVSFDAGSVSVPGHVYFVTPNQVDVQIPWELQGLKSAAMKVSVGDSQSTVYTVPLADVSPAAFEIPDTSGNRTVAAALDANNKVISSANPAQRGKIISLYANGLGAVDHTPPSGDPTPPPEPFVRTVATPTVTIGGVDAPVSFSGLSPFSVGLYQINVTVPAQAPAGLQPMVITIRGVAAKTVNLPVQ
jgi:uncharacterized protein (TIGR03437 family)